MAQYRRAAQSRGYKPRQVDQGNIQRMREESDRTARNMRERAEMEVSDRRRSLAQQKEDQAATRRMEEKNYQISTDNSRREIEGLRLKAQQESRQASLDIEASNTIFQSIAKFSATAMDAAFEIEKKKTAQKYDDDVNKPGRTITITLVFISLMLLLQVWSNRLLLTQLKLPVVLIL